VGHRHNRVTRNRQDHQRTTKERRMTDFEFERGREAGVKWGERFERERIIKLLKTEFAGTHFIARNADELIALIKGENK
jgi:hypothetical protein